MPERQASAGVDDVEIEVTREMALAGMVFLSGFNSETDSTYETAEEVYRAMRSVRRSSSP